ncbi:MAG: radical SAM peptide maturase [Candidatus Odinarchaeota archaeon]
MKSYFFFKTSNNNYLYSLTKKELLICDPIFYSFSKEYLEEVLKLETAKKFIQKHNPNQKELPALHKLFLLKDNGYFEPIKRDLSLRLTRKQIENSLANTRQITFEVTEKCNLKCHYCGYGRFYGNYGIRDRKDLNIEYAKNIIDFVFENLNSDRNESFGSDLFISFYGGEPLLRIEFIKKVVEYSKNKPLNKNGLKFSITTNGLLLEKYIDYLVKNNFHITISIDGDQEANSYRVFHDKKESHSKLEAIILNIKNRFPEYFASRISFNTVLHDRSFNEKLYSYFKEKFNKLPSISELNNNGILPNMLEEFESIYCTSFDLIAKHKKIEERLFVSLSSLQNLSITLYKSVNFCYNDYHHLICNGKIPKKYPSGTCIPFSKKLFITAEGKILPCERIGTEKYFGIITKDKVNIEVDHILEYYNSFFSFAENICSKCYLDDECVMCLYFFKTTKEGKLYCPAFLDYSIYKKRIAGIIEALENRPELSKRIFNEVQFDF